MDKSVTGDKWNALLKKEGQSFQNVINKTNKDINQIKDMSDNSILTQNYKTVNGILNQRATSLQTIVDLHTEYFGESVSFGPLIPDLGENNVIIHGEWLALKQPPVLSNGVTLVPIRPILEKLDPAIKLNKKDDTITFRKPNVTITMTLNMNSASVNGKKHP